MMSGKYPLQYPKFECTKSLRYRFESPDATQETDVGTLLSIGVLL